MIKKLFKRGLSLLLALVLVVTTFFIFDPDLIKLDADAYVGVEPAEAGTFLSAQTFYATETIYLKSGTDAFQYYENFSYATGTVSSPVDTSGSVYFKNEDASAVYLLVNNFYKKGGSQMPVNSLTINSTPIEKYAGLADGSKAYSGVGTIVAQVTDSGTLNYPITSGSFSGWVEGGVYIIEWLIGYVIDDGDNSATDTDSDLHYAFAYTGIYATPNDQAGITLAARHQNDDATSHQYNFITGGHKVSGGNAYSAITDTSGNTKLDPLHGFVGEMNNSTNYTVKGGTGLFKFKSSYFPEKAGGGVAAQTFDETSCGGDDTGWGTVEVSTHHATYSEYGTISTGTYDSPNAKGTVRRSFSDNSEHTITDHMTGVAYLLVDTSRYSNYNQIPNFKVGWLQFYTYRAGRQNNVTNMYVTDATGRDSLSSYSINFDSGNFDNQESKSATRGLYGINGPITEGLKFVRTESRVTRDRNVSDHRMLIYTNVGFHTTTWNQSTLRMQYNEALCSYVDYKNIQDYAPGQAATYKASFYDNIKAAGEELADPTAHSVQAKPELSTYVANTTKAIREGSAPEIFFYVPEVAYINPIANNDGTYSLQYFVDRQQADNGALNKDGEKTSGNIYFSASTAASVKSIDYRQMSEFGANTTKLTIGQPSSSSGKLSTTFTGTVASYSTSYIEWTLTYVTKTGQELKATAYTCCYPSMLNGSNHNGVISATSGARRNGSRDGVITTTGWIVGAHTVDSRAYVIQSTTSGIATNNEDNGVNWDHYGAYVSNWLQNRSTIAPTDGSETDSSFDALYNTSMIGGSGYWASNDSVSYPTGGKGTIRVDSSRYTNLNQIPNLYAGVDANNADKSDNTDAARHMYLNSKWYGGTDVEIAKQENLPEIWGGQNGARQVAKINADFSPNETGTKTAVLTAHGVFNLDGINGYASCYLVCNFVDKSSLREANDNAIKKSQFLQKEYFNDTAWKAYYDALIDVQARLLHPEDGNTDYTTRANTLTNQVNKLMGAVTATEETYTYEMADGSTATAKRSDVLKKGTVTVYHVLADLDDSGKVTSVTDIASAETDTYYFGDTIVSGYNEYEGYNYFGHYLSTDGTKWTGTGNLGTGVLKGDMAAQGTYGSSGHNRYALAKSSTVTYTYVYTKDPSGVYMDYGIADTAFLNKDNRADLTNVEIDTAYTGDGTLYGSVDTRTTTTDDINYSSGAAIVSKTGKDSFNFSIQNTGYNTYTSTAKGLNNIFNFDNYVWTGSNYDTSKTVIDKASNTVRMVANASTNDAYIGAYGSSQTGYMTLTPGRTYVMSYNWRNNGDTSQSVYLKPYVFFSSTTPFSYTGTNTPKMYTEGEANGTHMFEFTVPSDKPYVAFRYGIGTGGADITFSDLTVVDTTDSSQFGKMNDIFLPEIATGLTGGKTYTVAFKSSLRYDDYRWYAINMYGGATPEMDWAHEQGTIQAFISTTSTGADGELTNYTVPVRVSTDITSGGTIGTFDLPAGCSVINLGFCVTNDTPLTGWVEDIRIVEGDYVEIGFPGETYTILPDPVWEGYTFAGWQEKSAPFNGALSGELNRNYTYGTKSDTILANWTINKYDVTFDNEFDFDKGWSDVGTYNAGTEDAPVYKPRGEVSVDYDENTFTLTTGTDSTAQQDNTVLSNCIVDLVPGHRYRLSYDYNVTNYVSGGGMQNHIFLYGNETDAKNNAWNKIGFIGQNSNLPFINGTVYPSIAATNARTGTIMLEFVAPANAEFARLRLGNTNQNGMEIAFSDIYWQDITRVDGGNQFDFSKSVESGSSKCNATFDYGNKTIRVANTAEDSWAGAWNGFNMMELVPGHSYTLEFDYTNNNDVLAELEYFLFGFTDEARNGQTTITASQHVASTAKSGTFTVDFTVPEDKPFVTLRLGAFTSTADVTFSNISVKDKGGYVYDETVSEPHLTVEGETTVYHGFVRNYLETIKKDEITELPIISSELYDFEGWYTGKNGTGTKVTVDDQTQPKTNQKWSHWTVHLDYLLDSTCKFKEGYSVPASVPGIAIGGSATIVDYVPYKIGYNFGGWKDSYTGKVYQPGDTVTLYCNANLTPVWTAATDVSKDAVYGELATLYPGQIYFYAYTPATNNEYVSGYVYDTTPDMNVALYSATELMANGSKEVLYGLSPDSVDSLVSGGLTKGTEYYFGITNDVDAKTTVVSNFKITEHTINYILDSAGATDPVASNVTGHYDTATALPIPTRTGYSFSGWKNEANVKTYTDAISATDNNAIILVNANSFVTQQKLTALWNVEQFNLNVYAYYNTAASPTAAGAMYSVDTSETAGYVAIGEKKSTNGVVSQPVTYNTSVTYSAVAKTGYTFKGWYSAPTMSGNQITAWGAAPDETSTTVTISNMGAADKNMYARFDINEYTVNVYAYSNSSEDVNNFIVSTAGGTVKLDTGLISQKYVYGQKFTMTAIPATGYEFKGWYYNENSLTGPVSFGNASPEVTVTDNLAVNGVINYKAKFEVRQYQLSINANGGTVSPETYTGYMGATVAVTEPTRLGYSFVRWDLTNDINGSAYGVMVDTSYTFGPGNDRATAVWAVNSYTVTIDPNGGEVKVNYYSDGDVDTKTAEISTSTVLNMDYNTTASINRPTKTGYSFDKWVVTNNTGTFIEGTAGNASTYKVGLDDNSVVIQATWIVQQYSLKLQAWGDAEGSEDNYTVEKGGYVKIGADGTEGVTVESNIDYGSTATIYAIPQTGYNFLGWQASTSGQPSIKENLVLVSTSAEFKTAAMTDKGLEYYAVFAINRYDISVKAAFNSAAAPEAFVEGTTGGTVTGAGTFSHGEDVTVKATANAGYTFIGWYNAEGEEVSVSQTHTFDATSSTTLTARFSVSRYTINAIVKSNTALQPDDFLNNEQAGTVSGIGEYYHGQQASLTATPKTGYEFVAWYNDAELKDKATDSATLTITVSDIAVYYAKFEVMIVDINLQATTGGTVSYDGQTYGETATGSCTFGGQATIYAMPDTGYQFDGWYSDSTLETLLGQGNYHTEGYYDYNFSVESPSGTILYAKFSLNSYLLRVYAYNNTGVEYDRYAHDKVGGTVGIVEGETLAGDINTSDGYAAANVYFGKQAKIVATPATGYNFDGWYTDSALSTWFSNAAQVETAAMETSGREYYAKFTVGSFTINYHPNGGANISTPSATAYYNTQFQISSETPVKTGYTFLGWSVEDSKATMQDYVVGGTIAAGTISDWYANVYEGKDVTLYAVWIVNANYIIAKAAYSPANSDYRIGTTGGTVKVVSRVEGDTDENGNVVVPAGAYVHEYLEFDPAPGYGLVQWKYKYVDDEYAEGDKININTWGGDNVGTGSTTMPSQILYVVAFFEILTFSAEAKAFYNTAAETDVYSYGATGGTVKCGANGKNASNAVSENMNFGGQVEFTATPAKGYSFIGWYGEPVFVNDKVTEWGTPKETKPSIKLEVKDNSVDKTLNNYYAVFSINHYKATASVKTYSVREDLISSLAADQWPGGTPSNNGGNVGLGLTSTSDDTWIWSEAQALSPTINVVYYGERVYFEAQPNKGYIFGGWYNAENAEYYGENLVEETSLTYSRIMREAPIYMEAKFVPVSFTLVLDANGGVEGNPTEIILTYNADANIESSSVPTKTGSTFIGWTDAANSTDVLYKETGTVSYKTVNGWFEEVYNINTGDVFSKTIYAVWETAYITINFDKQGATGGDNNTQITQGSTLKPLGNRQLPEYEGFVFGGYYSEIGGKGTQYYYADGTATAAVWNNPSDGTIYALWTCPVLESIDYKDGKWVYTYRDETGGNTPVESATAVTSATELTKQVANDSNLMWWTKNVDTTTTDFVEKQIEKTPEINLNHYSDSALVDLRAAVIETNTDEKLDKLTQPQANAYVARMAKDMELDFEANKKSEDKVPTIKLFENAEKVNKIKGETIVDAANSANGSVYGVPSSSDAASYAYAGKWSYTAQKAVDYYLYTNSPNPVIALEIGDGDVASTVAANASSYPTKATVTDNAAGFGYVDGKYMTSAVKATDDLDNAWFTQYTTAKIGTAHDYNAKTVVYLTPEFTSSGTQNEIVYTIKASDDAYVPNEGVGDAELDGTNANLQTRFSSYVYDKQESEDITICICYHNSMNGDSDEGTLDASGDYMQMYMDQVNIDKKINQLHLFRTSGGASNWEFPTAGENVYPVEDRNYPYSEIGYTLGSFMYVFDPTNEETAASYAAAGDYALAKQAIIESVKGNAGNISTALANRSNSLNLNGSGTGLGFVQITGWSNNFYPKTGSYVYVHLVDRWGNVFNRVWECYNVDSYPSTINGVNGTSVYNVFEDGGSNIDTMNLDGANVEFILDDTSSYENGVFTTTGNSVSIATGEANKTYSLTVTDKATNTNTVEVTTDGDGVLVLNVEDACADLSAGAYTFTLNGETVNLYSGVTKLVYNATITDISQVGMETVVTVKTSKDVVKLQLVEGVATRTYTREAADSVVENEDGTLTWTMKIKPAKGVHSYALKAKTVNGWETTEYTLTTEVVKEYVSTPIALKSVYDAKVEAGEKPVIKARTQVGTQKLQLVYSSGATITYNRSDDIVITTVDDVETWALTGSAFGKAGEYEVKVRAKYNNEWQDASAKISTVTVTEKTVDTTPVILSVEAQSASAKIYDYVTFKVVTNSNATKIRFNYPDGSTNTFAENPEYTVVNADGTKTWTVAVKFYVLGENDITFSTRNADGWVDAQKFGTIEITK